MRYIVKNIDEVSINDRIAPVGSHYACVVAALQLNGGRVNDYLWGRFGTEEGRLHVMKHEPPETHWVVVDTLNDGEAGVIVTGKEAEAALAGSKDPAS